MSYHRPACICAVRPLRGDEVCVSKYVKSRKQWRRIVDRVEDTTRVVVTEESQGWHVLWAFGCTSEGWRYQPVCYTSGAVGTSAFKNCDQKHRKKLHNNPRMEQKGMTLCPWCHHQSLSGTSHSEDYWGTVEQHYYCEMCGFAVEQSYSPVYDAFIDNARGHKNWGGKYFEKDVKRHKRIRRKACVYRRNPHPAVNPLWTWFV